MLTGLCVLLPAIVVGAQQRTPPLIEVRIPIGGSDVDVVEGVWKETELDGDDDVIVHHGDKWPGKEGYPLVLFKDPRTFTNGTASIEFKLLNGSDDFSAGLAFGYSAETKSYFYVRYNTKDGNVALWRMDGPKRTVIKHGEHHEQLSKNAWHRLELTVDGRKVHARVAGRALEVEHELDQAPSGRLGLWTKPDATSAFRNLDVSARRR